MRTNIVAVTAALCLVTGGVAFGAWGADAGGEARAKASILLPPPTLNSGKSRITGTWRVTLCWTHTPTGFADGYEIFRSTTSGTGYTSIGSVSGIGTVSFIDASGLVGNGTYYYMVRSTKNFWRSANSVETSQTLIGAATTC